MSESLPVKRWKGVCSYDGTDFEGWQSQPRGNTIQDILESRLHSIFKYPVRIQGSARTDSGVHARQQVFHFDAAWGHPPDALFRALYSAIPEGILLKSLKPVNPSFHALHSATGKRYIYRIHEGQAEPFDSRYCWSIGWRTLNIDNMRRATEPLIGTHDFTAFSAAGGSPGDNPVKEVRKIEIKQRGSNIKITVEGSGFLYKMVRRITGMLYNVGLNRLDPNQVKTLLENRKRELIIHTAPAKGLCLERVFYK
jgi:tRNA pseudouridine38-40 synthase